MRISFYFKYSSVLILWLLCQGILSAQVIRPEVLLRIEAKMAQLEEKGFSGVVSLAKGNQVLFEQSYGWAGPEMSRKNSLDRRFMIASVSKSFVAACILRLEQEGKLHTDDFIGQYLPGYPAWAGTNITIHHLLTHTSGIPDYINDRPIWFKMKQIGGWEPDTDELISTFENRPLNFVPGAKFKYSNSGYVLLAKIIENVSGVSFAEYLYKNVLNPLQMQFSGVGDFDMVGNRAVAYTRWGNKLKPVQNFKSEVIFGMGEMYSTAPDLRKWLHSFADTMVLSTESKRKMMTPEAGNYGYGWHVHDIMGRPLISHGGYLPGWNSYVYYFTEDSVSVIVVSNSENANPIDICTELSKVYFLNLEPMETAVCSNERAGRFELATENQDPLDSPFESDIVTLSQSENAILVKTPRGKTLYFKQDDGFWVDSHSSMKIEFTAEGKTFSLMDLNGKKVWEWRKLGMK